jgi:hypothetical protein
MKIITIIIIFYSSIFYSQKKEILELEKSKKNLIDKINVLDDSLKIIEKEIVKFNYLKIKTLVADSSLVSIARKGAYIKKSSEVYSDIILKLTEKKEVVLLDYLNGYFGVCTDLICGYMNEMWIEKNNKINEFIKVKEQEQKELKILKEQKEHQKEKEEFARLEKNYIQKYGKSIYQKLNKRMYWIGMNKEMAKISLGHPNSINRTVGSWGVHEQWVYVNVYLYFENGKLTSYQN